MRFAGVGRGQRRIGRRRRPFDRQMQNVPGSSTEETARSRRKGVVIRNCLRDVTGTETSPGNNGSVGRYRFMRIMKNPRIASLETSLFFKYFLTTIPILTLKNTFLFTINDCFIDSVLFVIRFLGCR